MSRWTHRICADCYIDRFETLSVPTRMVPDLTPQEEPCCFCRVTIINVGLHGGIYIRHDPAQLECTHD